MLFGKEHDIFHTEEHKNYAYFVYYLQGVHNKKLRWSWFYIKNKATT